MDRAIEAGSRWLAEVYSEDVEKLLARAVPRNRSDIGSRRVD